ncbi:hypothetical protein AX15_007254 [Amanita polypyramis BW_CC]|nr:hypothetical protein AX15_007254 [Amanita polypyramis BW_CC]
MYQFLCMLELLSYVIIPCDSGLDVNKHFMSPCDLHKIIDSVFAKSTFHRNAPDDEDDTGMPDSVTRRSPRKSEKRPVYVLNLTLPPETIDNCLEPNKSTIHVRDMDIVLSFLAAVIRGFLKSHGYATEPDDEEVNKGKTEPPRKKPKIEIEDNTKRNNILMGASRRGSTVPPCIDPHTESEYQRWTDGRTGQTFVIDSRTGNSCNAATTQQRTTDVRSGGCRERCSLSLQTMPSTESNRATTPTWLKEVLKNNSAYMITDNGIPVMPNCYCNHEVCTGEGDAQIRSVGPVYRFEKEDLRRAEVIGQVDRKFIACLIRGRALPSSQRERNGSDATDDPSLVLIDQHAADERIRVEHYLKELCQGFLDSRKYGSQGVKVQSLEPPIPLLLTRHEALRLVGSRDLQAYLGWWGVHFSGLSMDMNGTGSDSDSGNNHGYFQVLVKNIPQVVSDKLVVKDQLRDLIKSILSHPDVVGPNNQEPDEYDDPPSDDVTWLGGLRCCPQGLLDLINSKACRGAIMFNDSLSLEQCKRLVHQLSEMVFPFQCAHGRPSLVPVANTAISRPRRLEVTRFGWSRLGQ